MTPLESVFMLSYEDCIDKKTMNNVSPRNIHSDVYTTAPHSIDRGAGPLSCPCVQRDKRQHCGDVVSEEADPPGPR